MEKAKDRLVAETVVLCEAVRELPSAPEMVEAMSEEDEEMEVVPCCRHQPLFY